MEGNVPVKLADFVDFVPASWQDTQQMHNQQHEKFAHPENEEYVYFVYRIFELLIQTPVN